MGAGRVEVPCRPKYPQAPLGESLGEPWRGPPATYGLPGQGDRALARACFLCYLAQAK